MCFGLQNEIPKKWKQVLDLFAKAGPKIVVEHGTCALVQIHRPTVKEEFFQ